MRCSVDGQWLHIAVSDTGIGIAPEFLPYMFDRFRQADSRSTRSHGGLGLGLAIARHMVEQHGGQIEAHSKGPGLGTTIAIRLPAAPPVAASIPATPTISEVANLRLDGLTIVVVDDQPDSRDMLRSLLGSRGATTLPCDSVATALQQMTSARVDLIVADIGMPESDGFDLIRRVRANGSRTPAIAVTAYARAEDRTHAIDSGYAAYCAKPIEHAAAAHQHPGVLARSS